MNISPRKDMEGAKTVISVMAISALTNTLSKGQENGDATKVEASGKLEIVNEQTPVIDTKFGVYLKSFISFSSSEYILSHLSGIGFLLIEILSSAIIAVFTTTLSFAKDKINNSSSCVGKST